MREIEYWKQHSDYITRKYYETVLKVWELEAEIKRLNEQANRGGQRSTMHNTNTSVVR